VLSVDFNPVGATRRLQSSANARWPSGRSVRHVKSARTRRVERNIWLTTSNARAVVQIRHVDKDVEAVKDVRTWHDEAPEPAIVDSHGENLGARSCFAHGWIPGLLACTEDPPRHCVTALLRKGRVRTRQWALGHRDG
jgi:hypothetical protein